MDTISRRYCKTKSRISKRTVSLKKALEKHWSSSAVNNENNADSAIFFCKQISSYFI
jgi:hypothetical protein